MDVTEKSIFTNMVMVENEKGEALFEKRVKGSWTGYALPGGHVNPGESFTESAAREVMEETGCAIRNIRLHAVKQFVSDEDARYLVFLYKADYAGGEIMSSEEGPVFWAKPQDIQKKDMAPSFCDMLSCFLSDNTQELHYVRDAQGNMVLHAFGPESVFPLSPDT